MQVVDRVISLEKLLQALLKAMTKNRGRIIRFDDKTVIDNSAVNDETKKLSKIMILEPKSKMLKNKEIITLSSSEDEEIDRSNCKDFFTTKYDSNTFQNNNLDSAVAVSAHKKEPKDDSDRTFWKSLMMLRDTQRRSCMTSSNKGDLLGREAGRLRFDPDRVNMLCLTVQSALVSFLRTYTGRSNHPLYCLDRPTVHVL
uniref:Uncharacterized protein n=1 Tax=Timema monikensis TaxID=170555 RepID=A0A7R9EF85_9NEOP|nr:unnamed protein product [Timema monikensis]